MPGDENVTALRRNRDKNDRPRSKPDRRWCLYFFPRHDASISTPFLHHGFKYANISVRPATSLLMLSSARGAVADATARSWVRASTPRNQNRRIRADLRRRTRKIQQFDFGLSFGGQAIGVPASASIPLIPEPVEASQSSTAPTAATPPSTVTAQSIAQGDSRPQRTPGSARNQLPQRPSTFDIPPDNGHGERQSNKKRKLSV